MNDLIYCYPKEGITDYKTFYSILFVIGCTTIMSSLISCFRFKLVRYISRIWCVISTTKTRSKSDWKYFLTHNIWAATFLHVCPTKTQNQSVHPRFLIRIFAALAQSDQSSLPAYQTFASSAIQNTHRGDSDQTARMQLSRIKDKIQKTCLLVGILEYQSSYWSFKITSLMMSILISGKTIIRSVVTRCIDRSKDL